MLFNFLRFLPAFWQSARKKLFAMHHRCIAKLLYWAKKGEEGGATQLLWQLALLLSHESQ